MVNPEAASLAAIAAKSLNQVQLSLECTAKIQIKVGQGSYCFSWKRSGLKMWHDLSPVFPLLQAIFTVSFQLKQYYPGFEMEALATRSSRAAQHCMLLINFVGKGQLAQAQPCG